MNPQKNDKKQVKAAKPTKKLVVKSDVKAGGFWSKTSNVIDGVSDVLSAFGG